MTEAQISLLCKFASNLPHKNKTPVQNILESYYMMRSVELTKGYGLPRKYYSNLIRCTHCYRSWQPDTIGKIKTIKLSKNQKRGIRKKSNKSIKSSSFEQICTFCKHSTVISVPKPESQKALVRQTMSKSENDESLTQTVLKVNGNFANKPNDNIKKLKKNKKGFKNKILPETKNLSPVSTVNLYSKAKEIFSLKNEKNTIASTLKDPIKVIKNCKRKKDKYAGLCQKAVMSVAKLREQQDFSFKQNKKGQSKLNLFLKASS